MNAFLHRPGSKRMISDKIIKYFPDFDSLISPFFGTGSIEIQFIGKIKYLICNDIDNNVYNLYDQVINNFSALLELIELTPYHENTLSNNANNTHLEKAVNFLIRSNYTFMAKGSTYKFSRQNSKRLLKSNLLSFYKMLVDNNVTSVQFMSVPFQEVFKKIDKQTYKHKPFIYCDPPYINTDQSAYKTKKWEEFDFINLIIKLIETKQRFAISEFNSPKIR